MELRTHSPVVAAGAIALLVALSACGGGSSAPPLPPAPGGSTPGANVYDQGPGSCKVSYDGVIWYSIPSGAFSPIDVKKTDCSSLGTTGSPPRPKWAFPHGGTQARFVAVSLQQAYSLSGMIAIENAAAPHDVPVSWMIDSFKYLTNKDRYNTYRASNGDDVEANSYAGLVHRMQYLFPWYVPTVSVEGAGHERNISGLLALGEHAFWGITWNSHGIDGTYDYGAPWGTYCADPKSYKRPDPSGGCSLLAFEWTARDLTRAYISGHEEYYSTDPDDLLQRAGFSASSAQQYVRALADAYAAAGETQPIVMVSQQESAQGTDAGSAQILSALYDQAKRDGMKVENLVAAAADGKTFSAAPRAVAFPFIPGGTSLPSSIVNGQTVYPATIDYHDTRTGMSFLSGHTMPTRVFPYADDPASHYNVPLKSLPSSQFPTLQSAAVSHGTLTLEIKSPAGMHFGIALWSNPAVLHITDPNATPAGRAGEVITFDLRAGTNHVSIHCGGCRGTTLPYST